MNNKQKIIEAQANLQAAQMLDAIEAVNVGMLEFAKIRQHELGQAKKALYAVELLSEAVNKFQKHQCNLREVKLVSDIVKGIQLRSEYEARIDTLERRLGVAGKVYRKLIHRQQEMQKFILELAELPNKKDRSRLLQAKKWQNLDEILDIIVTDLTPRCEVTNEAPF